MLRVLLLSGVVHSSCCNNKDAASGNVSVNGPLDIHVMCIFRRIVIIIRVEGRPISCQLGEVGSWGGVGSRSGGLGEGGHPFKKLCPLLRCGRYGGRFRAYVQG